MFWVRTWEVGRWNQTLQVLDSSCGYIKQPSASFTSTRWRQVLLAWRWILQLSKGTRKRLQRRAQVGSRSVWPLPCSVTGTQPGAAPSHDSAWLFVNEFQSFWQCYLYAFTMNTSSRNSKYEQLGNSFCFL